MKGLKDDALLLGWNTDAGVGHFKADNTGSGVEDRMVGAPTALGDDHAEGNPAMRSELESIRQEIFQNLLETLEVGVQALGQQRVLHDVEGETPIVGDVAETALHRLLNLAE